MDLKVRHRLICVQHKDSSWTFVGRLGWAPQRGTVSSQRGKRTVEEGNGNLKDSRFT